MRISRRLRKELALLLLVFVLREPSLVGWAAMIKAQCTEPCTACGTWVKLKSGVFVKNLFVVDPFEFEALMGLVRLVLVAGGRNKGVFCLFEVYLM